MVTFIAALALAPAIAGQAGSEPHTSSFQAICEDMWRELPHCREDEPNPFVHGGLAEHLDRDLEIDGDTAKVYAVKFNSYVFTVWMKDDRGGKIIKEIECRYPVGWQVDLARTGITYPRMLSHDDFGGGALARCGVLMTGKVWGGDEHNTSVYWEMHPSGPTQDDLERIRSQLGLPESHSLSGSELSFSEASMNRGAAIAFSEEANPSRVQYWSVYPGVHHASPVPDAPGMRFLPDAPFPDAASPSQLVSNYGAAALQGQVSWDTKAKTPLCSRFDYIEGQECSWWLPRRTAELFDECEKSGKSLFAHFVWYMNPQTVVVTYAEVNPAEGSVQVQNSTVLPTPERLGLPSLRGMGHLQWP